MGTNNTIPTQIGPISRVQYVWLKKRLSVGSDAQACVALGVGGNTVRHWKRSHRFSALLDLVKNDRLQAVKMLAGSQAEAALEALEWLLVSDKGSDKKAGLEAWRALVTMGGGKDDHEDLPQAIINILNMRGPVETLPDREVVMLGEWGKIEPFVEDGEGK